MVETKTIKYNDQQLKNIKWITRSTKVWISIEIIINVRETEIRIKKIRKISECYHRGK